VCARLFGIVGAHRAYFGRKDFQQLAVVRRLVADLAIRTEIVDVPTVREPDGLALSSRNAYLGPEQRVAACVLSRSLAAAQRAYAGGERAGAALAAAIQAEAARQPLLALDYAAVVAPDTLEPADRTDDGSVALIAGRIGNTRLIDNTVLSERPIVLLSH
jgi:pantoate--beta-alanine ligase